MGTMFVLVAIYLIPSFFVASSGTSEIPLWPSRFRYSGRSWCVHEDPDCCPKGQSEKVFLKLVYGDLVHDLMRQDDVVLAGMFEFVYLQEQYFKANSTHYWEGCTLATNGSMLQCETKAQSGPGIS